MAKKLIVSILQHMIIVGNCLLADYHKDRFVKIESNYSGEAISSYLTLSIIECISVCATNNECQAVTFHTFDTSCSLSGQVTEYAVSQSGPQSPMILSYMVCIIPREYLIFASANKSF